MRSWKPERPEGKWTPSLIPGGGLRDLHGGDAQPAFSRLHDWGETTLGMVTGNNRYFALSRQRAAELGLQESDVISLSPPGSRHLRGLTLSTAGLEELAHAGEATLLFRPAADPSPAAARYIARGRGARCAQGLQVPHAHAVVAGAVGQARRPAGDLHERGHTATVRQRGRSASPELGARAVPPSRPASSSAWSCCHWLL